MEDAWQIFEDRHQVRFYDHEKVPSKELIEKVLHKTHDLVPSKQKLIIVHHISYPYMDGIWYMIYHHFCRRLQTHFQVLLLIAKRM